MNQINEYLDYLQEDNTLTEAISPQNFLVQVGAIMGAILSRRALSAYLETLGYSRQDAALMGVGGLLGAYVIIMLALQIYRKHKLNAVRYCMNKTGSEKEKCLEKSRQKTYEIRISNLKKSLSACSKTKDPVKCKSKVNEEIKKVEKKLKAR